MKKVNRIISITIIICAMAGMTTTLHAQKNTPESQAAAMQKSLGLTDSQTTAVTSFYRDFSQQKDWQMFLDSAQQWIGSEQGNRFYEIYTKYCKKLESVLTDDQKSKLETSLTQLKLYLGVGNSSVSVGKPAPDFTMQDTSGRKCL